MTRRRAVGLLAAGLGWLAVGAGGFPRRSLAGGAEAAPAPEVKIADFSFVPSTLTVAAGTTVTWTNDDVEPHTVTSSDDPRRFKSAGLDTGDRFSFTFAEPGTYAYFCSVHPHMTGKIIVR